MTLSVLSMRHMTSGAFADALGESFRRSGFAMITDHGMDAGLIARGWAQTQRLFALPDDRLARYTLPGAAGQRGYTRFGVETAKGATAGDLKRFWHVGRDDHAAPANVAMPSNIWPAELPDFAPTMRAMFTAFEETAKRLLSAVAMHLDLDPQWFEPAVTGGNSILRLLHYPPVASGATAVRAQAHEDINLITLLLGAEESGLQLLTRSGEWIDMVPPPGALVVNVGDMLQRLSNHHLPSTSHRVANPSADRSGRSRYAMPFFLHPRSDFLIAPLAHCIDAAHPARDEPITAGAYLDERLAEIGLTGT